MTAKSKARRGRTKGTSSPGRSEKLKGRPSPRKGIPNQPRSEKLQGLKMRSPPDPSLKPWPSNFVVIVAQTQAKVKLANIIGDIIDETCSDCQARLVMGQGNKDQVFAMPERDGRSIKIICVACFKKYDRSRIDRLINNRTKPLVSAALEGDE